jgi:hypothetical protein
MGISQSSPEVAETPGGGSALDEVTIDLLIKEARRRQRRRWSIVAVALIVVALVTTVTAVESSNSSTPKSVALTPIKSFETLLQRASHERFVATYRIRDYTFFPSGKIVYAQFPSPPGTKAVMNADGYSGTGRYAYVFSGQGRIVQWIQSGTNASACMRLPAPYFTPLRCDRSSPIVPSNGYIEESVGLIQSTVRSWDQLRNVPAKSWTVSTERTSDFGLVQCLTLSTLSTKTCINSEGIVVTWSNWNGTTNTGRVSLSALNHDPTARDFQSLIQPTSKFFLPPQ